MFGTIVLLGIGLYHCIKPLNLLKLVILKPIFSRLHLIAPSDLSSY